MDRRPQRQALQGCGDTSTWGPVVIGTFDPTSKGTEAPLRHRRLPDCTSLPTIPVAVTKRNSTKQKHKTKSLSTDTHTRTRLNERPGSQTLRPPTRAHRNVKKHTSATLRHSRNGGAKERARQRHGVMTQTTGAGTVATGRSSPPRVQTEQPVATQAASPLATIPAGCRSKGRRRLKTLRGWRRSAS